MKSKQMPWLKMMWDITGHRSAANFSQTLLILFQLTRKTHGSKTIHFCFFPMTNFSAGPGKSNRFQVWLDNTTSQIPAIYPSQQAARRQSIGWGGRDISPWGERVHTPDLGFASFTWARVNAGAWTDEWHGGKEKYTWGFEKLLWVAWASTWNPLQWEEKTPEILTDSSARRTEQG